MKSEKFSRRSFLKMTALTAAGLALAACTTPQEKPTQSAKSEDQPTTVPQEKGQVTVEYFTYDLGQANKSREDMFAAFTEMNPNIAVKNTVLPYGENWDKLAALMAAGTPPDVIYGDFSLLRHALVGELLDLTEYFNADPILTKGSYLRLICRIRFRQSLARKRYSI